jgi:hypothetical protein
MSKAALLSLSVLCSAAAATCGDEPSPGALLRRIPTIRLEVAGGRIASPVLGRAANRTFSEDHGEIKESLNINAGGDEPSLSYRCKGPDHDWMFDLHGNSVRLQDQTAAQTLIYEQQEGTPLKLTLHSGAAPQRQIAVRSLWHALVFSPEFRDALLPRLAALRPDWELGKQADEIRAELIKADRRRGMQRRSDWAQAVARLGNEDYQVRQAADQALRSGGCAAAAFLESLDEEQLGLEQRRRVTRIVASAARGIDEPVAVAAAWCFDAEVWCRLLQDQEAEVRALAADHLAQLLGRPLVFDPSARAPIRTAQVRVIEETLLRR